MHVKISITREYENIKFMVEHDVTEMKTPEKKIITSKTLQTTVE